MRAINSIFITLLLALSFTGQPAKADSSFSYGQAVKEIFMQGSVDGKSLFLVLGFEDAKEFAKDQLEKAVDIENLKDIGGYVKRKTRRIGKLINNEEHYGDYVDAFNEGVELMGDAAEFVISGPSGSIKRMKNSYEVSFENAREAYFETENTIAAGVKYSGHAVWANVKGTYYLVVEAPTLAITGLVGTVLAVPGAVAYQTTSIVLSAAWTTAVTAIRLSGQLVRAIYHSALTVIDYAYSFASTGVAIITTSAVSGLVASYQGVKWIVNTPARMINNIRAKVKTEISTENLSEMVSSLTQNLEDSDDARALGIDSARAKVDQKRFTADITYKVRMGNKSKKAMKVKVSTKAGKLQISAFLTNAQFKNIRENFSGSKKEIKDILRERLENFISKSL